MKRILTILYSLLVLIAIRPDARAQGNKLQKSYEWEAKVSAQVLAEIDNYNCDLVIHTNEDGEARYVLEVIATMDSEEDARILDEYLESMKVSLSAGHIKIDNRFWESRITRGKKSTMELKNGEKVKYKSFDMKGILWIPSSARLELSSKYSVIEMEDIDGPADISLYNDKLYAGAVQKKLELEDKYSTIEFTELGAVSADIYSTNLDAAKAASLHLESKYSKVNLTTIEGHVKLDSYSDKFAFASTGDIKFINKYSDLNAGSTGDLDIDAYSSTVEVAGAQQILLKSKYGKYEIGKAGNLYISSAYSDNFKIKELEVLKAEESKYGTYRIEELSAHVSLRDGYSDKLFIHQTAASFKGFDINGKYVGAEISVDPALSYRFEAKVKYPKLEIPEEDMQILIKIKEGSSLEMKAFKGKESEGMPLFKVSGYDLKLVLN